MGINLVIKKDPGKILSKKSQDIKYRNERNKNKTTNRLLVFFN